MRGPFSLAPPSPAFLSTSHYRAPFTGPHTLSLMEPPLVTCPSLAFNNVNLPSPMASLLVICCLAPLEPLRSQLPPAQGQPRLVSLEEARPCWVWGGQPPPSSNPGRSLRRAHVKGHPLPSTSARPWAVGKSPLRTIAQTSIP